MTNKYSGLSGYDIDSEISEILKPTLYTEYCSNYNENAFKLMIDNKLDLDFNPLTNSWSCRKRTNKKYISSLNENPCRAIAECFLLMKDAERGE